MHFGDITTFLLHPFLLFFFFLWIISRNVAGAFEAHSFCLKLDHLMWPSLYVILKTWFLCPALYLVAQEMCPALGKNGVAYLTYPVSREDVKSGHCFRAEYRKYYYLFFLLFFAVSPGFKLEKLVKDIPLRSRLMCRKQQKRLHYYKKTPL